MVRSYEPVHAFLLHLHHIMHKNWELGLENWEQHIAQKWKNAWQDFEDFRTKKSIQKEKIKSIDLVEFNPLKDKNKITETIATNILDKLINNF